MTSTSVNSAPPDERVIESRVVNTLLWRLMPFLFLLYVVNYLDRINVGFAALQMRVELGFSEDVFGTAFGIFFLGYSVLQVPSNLAMTRVGARRWMAGIMVLWGVISCCMILVRTSREFYELRFLLGAAEAGFFPGIILYMKNWFPARARGRAVAWFMTANPLAGLIGGPISGALLNLHKFGVTGWRWMFILEGVPAILLAGVVYLTLHDSPANVGWLLPEEKNWLQGTLKDEHNSYLAVATRDVWGNLLRLAVQIGLLIIVYFGLTASAYGFILWLPTYIHSLSRLGNVGIGVVSVIPYVVTAGGMVVIGMLADRTGRYRAFLAGSALSAAGFLLIAAQTHSIVPGLAFVSLALMATFCMQGPFWATSTSLMSGVAAAAGIALINSLGNLGGYFGPKVIGKYLNSGAGFASGMRIIAATLAVAGVIALLVRKPRTQASPTTNNPLQ